MNTKYEIRCHDHASDVRDSEGLFSLDDSSFETSNLSNLWGNLELIGNKPLVVSSDTRAHSRYDRVIKTSPDLLEAARKVWALLQTVEIGRAELGGRCQWCKSVVLGPLFTAPTLMSCFTLYPFALPFCWGRRFRYSACTERHRR